MNTTTQAIETAEHKWVPVDLSLATAKHNYITGMHALNLADRASGVRGGTADWHEPAALWTTRPEEPGDHAGVNIAVPHKTLGEEGVEDGRYALRGTGHPGADSETPIWKANHARAIVDLAFDRWRTGSRGLRSCARFGPVCPWTIADWIWTETQMETLRKWAKRAQTEVDEADRRWWETWWRSLRFGASHEDYVGG